MLLVRTQYKGVLQAMKTKAASVDFLGNNLSIRVRQMVWHKRFKQIQNLCITTEPGMSVAHVSCVCVRTHAQVSVWCECAHVCVCARARVSVHVKVCEIMCVCLEIL